MKAKQIQDATVPVFSESGVLRPESRKAEWEVNGALTIEL